MVRAEVFDLSAPSGGSATSLRPTLGGSDPAVARHAVQGQPAMDIEALADMGTDAALNRLAGRLGSKSLHGEMARSMIGLRPTSASTPEAALTSISASDTSEPASTLHFCPYCERAMAGC